MSGRPPDGGTVGYLVKRFPRLSETFILDEILGLEAAGVPIRLYALAHPGEPVVQPDVARVASPVTYLHPTGSRWVAWRAGIATGRAHAALLRRDPGRYLGVVAYILVKRRHRSTLRHFAEAGRLALLLEEDRACHLHAAFAHGPASVAHLVHRLTGLPFSFAAHAKDLYLSAPDLLQRKVGAATFVLVCSRSAERHLRLLAGPAADRVVLAPHGVDVDRFAPPPGAGPSGPMRVLSVGRLVAKKGHLVLLLAIARVAAERPCSCRIIGSGPLRDQLQATIRRLGLTDVVTLVGSQTHQEVALAYGAADVFVQASRVLADGDRDGIPNSLLEAMASGLPVVASRVAGIPEVVDEGCGRLVAPGDSAGLADALLTLAADPALARRLGAAGRSRAIQQFDRAVCARSIAPLFRGGVTAAVSGEPASRPAAEPATRAS